MTHVAHNSGKEEWYTPTEILDVARRVMGRIDLDPASCEVANRTVGAERYFTKEQDGLLQSWKTEALWLNPPYGSKLITAFARKLCFHVKEGDIKQGLVLTNNASETAWFHMFASISHRICFPRSRLRFLLEGEEQATPLQGQALFYFSNDPLRVGVFDQEAAKIGLVVEVKRQSNLNLSAYQTSLFEALF